MLGVVIWSNPQERKAVIWCEDHGDLAYFNDESLLLGEIDLDAGDLVDFEMTTERDLRRVHNPRLVSERAFSGLDTSLRSGDGAEKADMVSDSVPDTVHDTGPGTETAAVQHDAVPRNEGPRSAQIIPISNGLARGKILRANNKMEAV